MDEYTQGLKSLEDEQKKKLLSELNARKTASLNEITPLEEQAKKDAITKTNAANVNSQINKLNFAEFLANRGQTNAGLAAQGELSRQNVLARGIGEVNTAENTQLNEYSRQRANVNTAYNADLTSGTQAIALDTASRLLAYKEQLRQEKLAQAEQLRREQVARDEATLAYRRSLSLKSAGGGGGFDDTPNTPTTTETSGLQSTQGGLAKNQNGFMSVDELKARAVKNGGNTQSIDTAIRKLISQGKVETTVIDGKMYYKTV